MSRSLATKCQDTILTLYSVFTVYCSLTAVTVNFRSTWNAVFTLPKFPPPFPLPPPFHVSTPTKWANVNAIQLILLIFKGAEMFVIEYRLFDKPSINYIFGSIPCLLKQRLFEPCIFRLEGSSTFRNPGRWKWIRVQYLAVALVSFWTWVPWHFSFFFFFFFIFIFSCFQAWSSASWATFYCWRHAADASFCIWLLQSLRWITESSERGKMNCKTNKM